MADNKSQTPQTNSQLNTTQIVTAVALIVIGILFCALRSGMLSILLTIVGTLLIVVGIYDLFKKDFIKGAIELAAGIIIIVGGWTFLDIALLLLGLFFIAYSIYKIFKAVPSMQSEKGLNKAMLILNPLLMLIFGILLVVAKWYMIDAIFIVIGVIAIVDGIVMLIRK